MKFPQVVMFYRVVSRAPQGARGLKSFLSIPKNRKCPVAPRKGRVG